MFLSCTILNIQNQYLFIYSTAIFNTLIQIPFVKLLFILHPIYSNFAIFCIEKKETYTLLKVLNAYYISLKIGKNLGKSFKITKYERFIKNRRYALRLLCQSVRKIGKARCLES